MRPEIDREKLAYHVAAFLEREGISHRAASGRFPGLNPAMLSRAKQKEVLSAASLLCLCRAMGTNPFDYLVTGERDQKNQAVTAFVQRETEAHRHG